jgi:glutamate synthase domain-containing protein 1
MSLTHGRKSGMGDRRVFPPFNYPDTRYPSCYLVNASFIVSCAPPPPSPFINLKTIFLLRGEGCNTSCSKKLNQVAIKSNARANQVIEVDIRIQSQDSNSNIEVLFSVDRLTQLENFENLLESNQTLHSQENMFLVTCSTSVQIYKIYRCLELFVSRIQTEQYKSVLGLESFPPVFA